jgi:DNA-binding transcriptional regulator YiaG
MHKKGFIYHRLGFPVVLHNFRMKKYWGEEMPDLNYNHLKRAVIELLASKPEPMTGNELRFVRQYFECNYTDFAKHFGQSRQAVAKWESKGDDLSLITPSTELHIRLFILDNLKASNQKFRAAFHQFDQSTALKKKRPKEEPVALSITPNALRTSELSCK